MPRVAAKYQFRLTLLFMRQTAQDTRRQSAGAGLHSPMTDRFPKTFDRKLVGFGFEFRPTEHPVPWC
jgi:hypothetical protein